MRLVWFITLLLLMPAGASAHQTGASSYVAHIVPESNRVDVLITFPGRDAADFLEWDADNDEKISAQELLSRYSELADYVDPRLTVKSGGTACSVTERRAGPAAQALGAYWYMKAFTCPSLTRVELTNKVMDETTYNHIAKVQMGEAVFTTTFSASHPTYTIDVAEPPAVFDFLRFLKLGVTHILIGLDHVLFVLLLVMLAATPRRLLALVTSFTVAHTITLGLSALEVMMIPASIIEPLIAASIVIMAVETIFRTEPPKYLVALTFFFGFVHGFGFASVLREYLGTSDTHAVAALATFNMGVEVGQLLIVLLVFPIRRWMCEKPWERRAVTVCSGMIGAIAIYWTFERIFWA